MEANPDSETSDEILEAPEHYWVWALWLLISAGMVLFEHSIEEPTILAMTRTSKTPE